MSLEAPGRLALVLAPLALLVAYVIIQRGRRKYTMRFASADLLASVAPRRPGWQRHISVMVMLLALVALVIGLARPVTTSKVPKKRGTILLTIDTSGSMNAADVAPTRLRAAEAAASQFVTQLPQGLKVGLISFNASAHVLVAPTADHPTVLAAINGLQLGSGTATADAISQALAAAAAQPADATGLKAPVAIVLMSDGSPTIGLRGASPEASVATETARAKAAGIPIDTIAFGTTSDPRVPADPAAMATIASGSGGKAFTATTEQTLSSVYDQIRRSVGYDTVVHDITVWLLAAGVLLTLLAATASLYWMQRIP
jgi:Ca-activated chloride channel family protein